MRWALAVSLVAVAVAGCSVTFNPDASICDPSQRTELLNVVLRDDLGNFTPSPPFTLRAGYTGWIQVTRDPQSAEGLFGNIAGIAEVHAIAKGATPSITYDSNGDPESQDPAVTIDKALTWQKLPLKSGSWQFYSFSNPGIEVVDCPAN